MVDLGGDKNEDPVIPLAKTGFASRSEAFKNICLGTAGIVSAILIPIVGLKLSDDQSKRQMTAQAAEATARIRSERDQKDKEIAHSFVELGIKILSDKPRADNDPVRIWAINVINHYSEIHLTEQAKQALSQGSFFDAPSKITAAYLSALPSRGYSTGVSISHHNGAVDFDALKVHGISFVYVKASQGTSSVDPMLSTYATAAHGAGLALGLYHFFDPASDPKAQATSFLRLLDTTQSSLPPVVDCEPTSGNKIDIGYADRLITFLKIIADGAKTIPAIYTYRSFANEHMDQRFSRFPLFLGDFSAKARASNPVLPRWWTAVTFWDLSTGVQADPLLSDIDIIAYRGSVGRISNGNIPVSGTESSPRR